jgi:hypothetical protein
MEKNELIKTYARRLARQKAKLEELEKKHIGNELNFTYWGGYEMGYTKGKISELEEAISSLEELSSSITPIKKEDIYREIDHIFESGPNEARIFNLINNILNKQNLFIED